jgi:hypothetical protein
MDKTAKEIKYLEPAPLPWHYIQGTTDISDNDGHYLCRLDSHAYSKTTDIANQLAIVQAVNNTFGQGVDPNCVGEMVKMLERIGATYYDGGIPEKTFKEITNITHQIKDIG